MTMPFYRKIYILFSIFLISAAALFAQDTEVRVLFFSDNYQSASSLQNIFEQNLSTQKTGYNLERVEKLPAYFSGQSYIFSDDNSLLAENSGTPQDFNNYRAAGFREIISTGSAIMFQQPFLDKETRKLMLPANAKTPLSPKKATAKKGVVTLQQGTELEVLSPSGQSLKHGALWLPAIMVKYSFTKNNTKNNICILQKPLGGIGAWFNPIQNIVRAQEGETLIINTGGLDKYERLSAKPAFLARYWQTMNTDAVAFTPKDAFIIYKGALAYPELKKILIASNIESIEDNGQVPFSKSAVTEKNGVKIGIISLSEPNSLDGAAGRGFPLQVTDPVQTANNLITELKEKQKADFIILVSHLKPATLNSLLEQTKGIDMLINAASGGKGRNVRTKTELKDWSVLPADKPAHFADVKADTLGDISIKFQKDLNGFAPVLIEDNPPCDIFEGNDFNNEFYPVNKYFFEDWHAKDNQYLLPSAKELSDLSGTNQISYSPAEFFNMAAAIIRKTSKTETAFIRIMPFKEKTFGTLSKQDLQLMLGQDEPVIKVKIKGKYLKKMLKLTDFDDPFTNTKDYSSGFALAVAGVEKDGKNYKINTLAVNDDEIYTAAFPEPLIRERLLLPELKGNSLQIKETGQTTVEQISSYLQQMLNENKEDALLKAEKYKKEREDRLENALPPPDEITEELDLKTSLQGPVAAEEYFTQQALDNYEKQIFTLIQNTPEKYGAWRYNLKKLSLLFSNTEVKNSEKYQNFSDSRLNSDSQTLVQGALDFAAEYYRDRIRWDNILNMKYGKTTLHPAGSPKSTNENADYIYLGTEYTYKSTDIQNFLGGFLIGPFASLGYQTEFTAAADAPRYKALRGRAGIRLFEGKYLKDFSIAVAPELDFTYPQTATKYAWQAVVKIEHPVNDNAKAVYYASLRDFFLQKHAGDTAVSYEFELSAKLEMEVLKSFYIAPFISYYQAQAEDFSGAGSNLYLGVSLSYSKLFKNLKL